MDPKASLDMKDRRILYELEKNARQPASMIGKAVRMHKDTVNYRIRVLERKGIIKGYYTVINLPRLGYMSIRVYIKFSNTTPALEQEITDFLLKQRNAFFIARLEGFFDLVIALNVRDIHEFGEFYGLLKEKYREHIEEKISIFTGVHIYPRRYLLGRTEESCYELKKEDRTEKLDKKDKKILKLLAENARKPLIEIASELRIPERTIAYRIRQLEKRRIILGYRPVLNLSALGYLYYKIDLFLSSASALKGIKPLVESWPYTVYVDHTIGWADFEFDVEVPSVEDIEKIISRIKREFPFIKSWISYRFREYLRMNYFPVV